MLALVIIGEYAPKIPAPYLSSCIAWAKVQ